MRQLILPSPPIQARRIAGLFFCLASDTVRGFSFYPDAIQPDASVYSSFCRVNAIIPPMPQNSAQGFTAAFPEIAPAQPPTIPDLQKRLLYHLCHAGGHTRARTRSTDTRYRRHAGALSRSAQATYYNDVYKTVQGCALLWIHARRCSISQTMPIRRGQRSGRAV